MGRPSQQSMKNTKYINLLKKTESRKYVVKRLDDIFSLFIRNRDDWTCIKCMKMHEPHSKSMTCSHYFNRIKWATRWDEDNCDAACMPCHMYHLEKQKQGWYQAFKKEQLGIKYDVLEVKSNTTAKYSLADLWILIRYYEGRIPTRVYETSTYYRKHIQKERKAEKVGEL